MVDFAEDGEGLPFAAVACFGGVVHFWQYLQRRAMLLFLLLA